MKDITPDKGILKDALKLIGICGGAAVDLAKFAWDNPLTTTIAITGGMVLGDVDDISDNSELIAQHITEYTAR